MLTQSGFESQLENDFDRVSNPAPSLMNGVETVAVASAANVTHFDQDSRHQRRMRRNRRMERQAQSQGNGWSLRLW